MIRHCIFDLGGVLVNWRPQEIIDSFSADPSVRAALRQHVLGHPDWLDLDRGVLDEDAATARFAARLGRPVAEMSALLDHIKASLTPIPESLALLEALRARGVALYALSNMSLPTYRYLAERHAFFARFRDVVISAAVGWIKPEEKIFAHATERFGVACAETVFIDDNAPNIDAAQRLGFATVLFRDPAQCARELELLLTTSSD